MQLDKNGRLWAHCFTWVYYKRKTIPRDTIYNILTPKSFCFFFFKYSSETTLQNPSLLNPQDNPTPWLPEHKSESPAATATAKAVKPLCNMDEPAEKNFNSR